MKLLRTSSGAAALMWLCMGASGAAMAQSTPSTQDASRALHARQLAANCAACHGTDGRTTAGSPLAQLAGMPAEKMVDALTEAKAGKRADATVMHQLAKGLSDEQIKTLADYFAAQKP